jgi:glycosyltransferase involved in cell wall biosynthesis
MIGAVMEAFRDYGVSAYAAKQALASSSIARRAVEAKTLIHAALARGDWYGTSKCVCQAIRLLEQYPVSRRLRSLHQSVLHATGIAPGGCGSLGKNRILAAFLRSPDARAAADQYLRHGLELASLMKFPRVPDEVSRQGNLVMLKPFDPQTREKGVLYLQYTESIRSFVGLFDLVRLAGQFRLVLEPSTWGYQDESYLLLVGSELEVVVQAQDEIDHAYVASLGSNLHPIRLGAGDWIDPQTFAADSAAEKEFDFVMVASWAPLKRHRTFFAALATADLRDARVALVGYPWEGHTRSEIEGLARRFGLRRVAIFERIPRIQVADVLRRSKVGVMLSRREGANRGLYECLFCDVPVLMSSSNRGVNKAAINAHTGRLFEEGMLPAALVQMLKSYLSFSPRAWALENTGRLQAWKVLDAKLKVLAESRGETYLQPLAQHTSAPGAVFVREADRARMAQHSRQLLDLLRSGIRPSSDGIHRYTDGSSDDLHVS